MGNCLGGDSTKSKKPNTDEKKLKFILLGAGESGKSKKKKKKLKKKKRKGTIFKQIKFKHSEGYNTKEKKELAITVRSNILTSLQSLITACATMKYEISKENQETADLINSWKPTEFVLHVDNEKWTKKFSTQILSLWKDEGIQKALEQRSKFQLLDSTE